jgi:ketol-acid reductoisomerase
VLAEIQSGAFAKEWLGEAQAGFPRFLATRGERRSSRLEQVGRELRRMMPWLDSEKKVAPDA